MSEILCKKCGCVVFDQDSEYCDACEQKQVNSEQVYINMGHKEFAQKNEWVESALNTMSYLELIIGIICSFLFAIVDWGSSYLIFDTYEFSFWIFILALFFTTLTFISWRVLVIIVRCCLKYLNS